MAQEINYQTEDPAPEIHSLLKTVYEQAGYDFRGYTLASLKHRIWRSAWQENVTSLAELEQKITAEPACLERLLYSLSVNTTTMFDCVSIRDRKNVSPVQHSIPYYLLSVSIATNPTR